MTNNPQANQEPATESKVAAKVDEETIDYKDIDFLNKFIAATGKILPRRITGMKASRQRRIGKAIKIARYLALLPYTENHRPYSVVVSSERKSD